jgi:uncharacterized protein
MVVSFALVFALAGAALAQRQFLSIGGGFVGGTFNVFASGIGDYLSQHFPNLNITVEGSAGSAENIRRMQAGEMEMAIAFAGDSYLAFNAMEDFDDQHYDGIRAVGFLYGAVSQLVTLDGSGIRSFEDLAGKRIALGSAGSGTHLSIERLLRQTGMFDRITRSSWPARLPATSSRTVRSTPTTRCSACRTRPWSTPPRLGTRTSSPPTTWRSRRASSTTTPSTRSS